MKSKLILISIVFLASLWGCSDLEDTPSSAEFNLADRYGSFVIDTVYAVQDTFIIGDYVDTDLSDKLSVGKINGVETSFLIKFLELPDSTLGLDSAYIILKNVGTFSLGMTSLDLDIYKVDKEWGDDVNKDETWHKYQPQNNPIINYSINETDSAEYKIILSPELVLEWMEDEDNYWGLLFKSNLNSDGVIKEFGSFNSSLYYPKIVYVMSTDTSTVRDTVNTAMDATIFDYSDDGSGLFELLENDNKLLVSSGVTVHSFLKFDFSIIPTTALIDRAEFQMEVDDDTTFKNPGHLDFYYLRSIIEADQDLSTYVIDSLFTLYSNLNYLHSITDNKLFTSESSQENFGKNLIQNIVDGTVDTEWLYLQYLSETTDFSVRKFCGLESYVNHPPRIIVKYFRVEQ